MITKDEFYWWDCCEESQEVDDAVEVLKTLTKEQENAVRFFTRGLLREAQNDQSWI